MDVAGHGERKAPDLEARKAGTQDEALQSVIHFARSTAMELPLLLGALRAADLVDGDRVGIAGISMGAFVVYRALLEDCRLAAAVAILGSPEWDTSDSPHRQTGKLCRVPLLSITAGRDTNVPPDAARRLHERLNVECGDRHRHVELKDADHLMNAGAWETTMRLTTGWLTDFFAAAG